jgi:hypothetical protein
VKALEHPFDDSTMEKIRHVAATLRPTDLEFHEARRFGRFVVHDHPVLTELQERTVPLVSEQVGEPVEAKYNFLSLYSARGVCSVHMDSPESKWTLDLCVEQSAPWPIFFSDVQSWPESAAGGWKNDGWENQIKQSRSVNFTSHTLHPGQAVIFSGSAQWHYRDPMPEAQGPQFCTLLFFHYIPKGTSDLVKPKNWARRFGIPELSALNEGESA